MPDAMADSGTGVPDAVADSDIGTPDVLAANVIIAADTGMPTGATSAPDAVDASNPGMSVGAVSTPPRKKRRAVKIALVAAGVLVLAVLAIFIPTLSLETPGMQAYEGEYVTVYYESEAEAAKDVFELAEAQSERIAHEMVHAYTSLFDNKLSYWMDNDGWVEFLRGNYV